MNSVSKFVSFTMLLLLLLLLQLFMALKVVYYYYYYLFNNSNTRRFESLLVNIPLRSIVNRRFLFLLIYIIVYKYLNMRVYEVQINFRRLRGKVYHKMRKAIGEKQGWLQRFVKRWVKFDVNTDLQANAVIMVLPCLWTPP